MNDKIRKKSRLKNKSRRYERGKKSGGFSLFTNHTKKTQKSSKAPPTPPPYYRSGFDIKPPSGPPPSGPLDARNAIPPPPKLLPPKHNTSDVPEGNILFNENGISGTLKRIKKDKSQEIFKCTRKPTHKSDRHYECYNGKKRLIARKKSKSFIELTQKNNSFLWRCTNNDGSSKYSCRDSKKDDKIFRKNISQEERQSKFAEDAEDSWKKFIKKSQKESQI